MDPKSIYQNVQNSYGLAARTSAHEYGSTVAKAFGYSEEELKDTPQDANLGLSCGNPFALASLKEVGRLCAVQRSLNEYHQRSRSGGYRHSLLSVPGAFSVGFLASPHISLILYAHRQKDRPTYFIYRRREGGMVDGVGSCYLDTSTSAETLKSPAGQVLTGAIRARPSSISAAVQASMSSLQRRRWAQQEGCTGWI